MTVGVKALLVIIAVLVGVIAGLLAERVARTHGCSKATAASWSGGAFFAAVGLMLSIENSLT